MEQGRSSRVKELPTHIQIWLLHAIHVQQVPSQGAMRPLHHGYHRHELFGPGTSVHAQILLLKASLSAVWEKPMRAECILHGPLSCACVKLQHQNCYWPLRSEQKSQILQAAGKPHFSGHTLPCPGDSFDQTVMQLVSWCCSNMGSAKEERQQN